MIKAVCFDFFNTLAYFEPSREDTYASLAGELGITVTPEAIGIALPAADSFWRLENFKSPIRQRPEKEKYAAYTEYATRILKCAASPFTPEQALQMLGKAFAVGFKFTSYNDSLPALKAMKSKNYITGVISNIGQEIDSYCNDLGFADYLDFKVTSFEVGYDKPRPEIFLMALEKAGVAPDEAIFIGDQYEQDIVGARGVGMTAVLIERTASGQKWDCQVINSLLNIPNII